LYCGYCWPQLRVDVGLSKGCGNGEVQVLEITEDGNKVCAMAAQWLLVGGSRL